jgi:hypothetical protein
MDVDRIVSEIDSEIARLQGIRSALAGLSVDVPGAPGKAKRGRPKGSKNIAKTASSPKRERRLTPEGRKRIAEAMKRRWAERRKAAGKS